MQVLLPAAGAGSRFKEMGYDVPKPLIDVRGKPMIQRVVENLGLENDYVVILQDEHYLEYKAQFDDALRQTNSFRILTVKEKTEGAACTALLAENFFHADRPLMIANCDQIMIYDRERLYDHFFQSDTDGLILTFTSTNPAHSYVKFTDGTPFYISEVAEKKVISDRATIGVYFWKEAGDFFLDAKEMIDRGIRTNGEFYIAPTYNISIEAESKIGSYHIAKHFPIGTPEQLKDFIENGYFSR